ncbi:MAG: LysE family transporter [Dehalococcoidia bacterium]
MEMSLGLYLLSAAAISFTGVMLPGPMTAATIVKGYSNKHAGAWIAAGHAVIEIPLIAAIYFGLGPIRGSPRVESGIYLAGGLMLLFLGFRMFRASAQACGTVSGLPASPLMTGIVITGTNPGFYAWWATLGTTLVVGAAQFGFIGVILFAIVHLPCDLAWSEFLSLSTYKSRRWWTQKVQRNVFNVCASILIGFGVWFCLSAFL